MVYLAFVIPFFAAFLKSLTGTGLGTIVVSFASLIIAPKSAVVYAAILSFIAGLMMMKLDNVRFKKHYFRGVLIFINVGMVAGALSLKFLPEHIFRVIMGGMLALVGIWYMRRKKQVDEGLMSQSPEKCTGRDAFMSLSAGFMTGLVGISIPILFYHFGGYLSKELLRKLIVIVFIPAAFFQVVVYAALGLIDAQLMKASIFAVPALIAGIFIGNSIFIRINEYWFAKSVGAFLIIVAAKVLFFQ